MTEKLWYPEFGLKDDPFQYNDFNNEYGFEIEIPRIKTQEVDRIKILKATAFIVGDRGVGKSTVLGMAAEEDSNHLFYSIASPSLTSFYNDLFRKLLRFYRRKGELKAIFERALDKHWFEVQTRHSVGRARTELDRIDCHYPYCTLRRRCRIPLKEAVDNIEQALDYEHLEWVLLNIEKYCPLKVHLVQKLIENLVDVEDVRYRFLLDAPDDLYKGINDFKDTVRKMQEAGNAIIMATREQNDKLKKSDYFNRLNTFEFIQMTNEEIEKLHHKRIKWVQAGGSYPLLLTEEALDYVVKKSIRNPRIMLKICEEVLVSMRRQKRVSPADVAFVEQKSRTAGALSIADYIMMLVKRYKEQKKRWVPVEQSVIDMAEQFNVKVSEVLLGRKLRYLHRQGIIPDQRYNPKSEYLYYIGILD